MDAKYQESPFAPPATYVPVQLLSFLIHIYEEEWKNRLLRERVDVG